MSFKLGLGLFFYAVEEFFPCVNNINFYLVVHTYLLFELLVHLKFIWYSIIVGHVECLNKLKHWLILLKGNKQLFSLFSDLLCIILWAHFFSPNIEIFHSFIDFRYFEQRVVRSWLVNENTEQHVHTFRRRWSSLFHSRLIQVKFQRAADDSIDNFFVFLNFFLFIFRQMTSHMQSQMIAAGERTFTNRTFELWIKFGFMMKTPS